MSAPVETPPAEPEAADNTIMLVGAIRAAAVTISSALFYMSRVSVTPPFDAKENPFDAEELFDETLNKFLGE